MAVVLYRRSLRLTSGAGQLMLMQARGLVAAGEAVGLAAERGRLKFWLRTGLRVRRLGTAAARRLAAAREHLFVDHDMGIPEADLSFVHNLASEALRHMARDDLAAAAAAERRYFAALRPDAPVVANSNLVRRALVEHFDLDPARVQVCHPGFAAARFDFDLGERLRPRARAALGLDSHTPLIGFVTSGDLHKRGLGVFLEAAADIVRARADARFLVVGSRRLPADAAGHALVRERRVLFRPKTRAPARWLAALDVFLYTALWEEFGMVVSEAQAMGVPVVTSRRVGATECMPGDYAAWLTERPDPAALAEKTLALLADDDARARLAAAARQSIARWDDRHYAEAAVALIRARGRAIRSAASGRA